MSRHTPGPWLIRKGDEWTYDVVTHHGELPDGSPNAWNVATINGRRDEAKDNLNLIAAAPELLEALENLLSHAEWMEEFIESERGRGRSAHDLYMAGEMSPIMTEAQSIIARAKGEQK